ncbi:MAG: hypothetical protein HKO92_12180 [Flavobacteriaceae bacterium]|nr:hypothetical protein [Flavobacteriaceae bacterium]
MNLINKYKTKKHFSKYSNIKFLLTYEEYLEKAIEAGITSPNEIGIKGYQFQLARYKDQGDYTVDNCRFITKTENIRERNEHYNHSPTVSKANKTKVKNKSHHFLGGRIAKEANKKRVENGTHHWLKRPPWESCNSYDETIKAWIIANEIYEVWNITKEKDTKLRKRFNLECKRGPLRTMIQKFNNGWVPLEDKIWIKFKEETKL